MELGKVGESNTEKVQSRINIVNDLTLQIKSAKIYTVVSIRQDILGKRIFRFEEVG